MFVYLNMTDNLSFIDELVAAYSDLYEQETVLEEISFSTLESFMTQVKSSTTTTYLSTTDPTISWQSTDEIDFFLNKRDDVHGDQNGYYLNNYVQNLEGNEQYKYCGRGMSDDYWVPLRTKCPDGYIFIWRVQPVWAETKDCYSIAEKYELRDIEERYRYTPMYQDCLPVDKPKYYETVIDLWSYANAAFLSDEIFKDQLLAFQDAAKKMYIDIGLVQDKVDYYYTILLEVYHLLEDLQKQKEYYKLGLDCSYFKERTEELRLGFCGDYVHAMFYSGISFGGLGVCNIGVSFSVILMLFKYRTNLEIEMEDILRRVGRVRVDPPERTSNEIATVQKQVDIILESSSRDGFSRTTSRMADTPQDFEEDNSSFFGDYIKRISKQ